MKPVIALALSVLAGSTIGLVTAAARVAPEPNPVRFYVDDLGRIAGTEFAAEGRVYTAKHVTDAYDRKDAKQAGGDVSDVGPAGFHGLPICREHHAAASRVRVLLARWPGEGVDVEGMVMGRLGDDGVSGDYLLRTARPLFRGVSGSPVVCDEHGAVIGVAARLEGDRQYSWASPVEPL
ncbi:MAG: hypothetical protein L0323_19110 [Planctomycetes bacterium]|nr:hypothetical protein [Planctomycetota bacterium]